MNTMTSTELDAMLKEAINALQTRSPIIEDAPGMSKQQLQENIDKHIDLISSGTLKGKQLEQAKAEARTLAVLKLRRERH
jgi:hypothetical protein